MPPVMMIVRPDWSGIRAYDHGFSMMGILKANTAEDCSPVPRPEFVGLGLPSSRKF